MKLYRYLCNSNLNSWKTDRIALEYQTWEPYLNLFRFDDLKTGTLVGTDKYGNKYYENPYYFYGRNRWVEYTDHVNMDYDGSQIPAEWYGWMHYKVCCPNDAL